MSKKKIGWRIVFLLFLIIATVNIVLQQRNTPYQHDEGQVFGTYYHITYQNDTSLNDDIMAELKKVDNSLSTFNPKSIISKVNRNEDVVADSMFTEVFKLAEQVSAETDGAFDITVAPLVNAWGFGFKNGKMPDNRKINQLRKIVGFHKVSMKSGRVVKKNPATMLDCSQGLWLRYGGAPARFKGNKELYGGDRRRDCGVWRQRRAYALEDRRYEAYRRFAEREPGTADRAQRHRQGYGDKWKLSQLLL